MVVLMADTVLGTELSRLMAERRLGPTELAGLAQVARRTVYNVMESGTANIQTLWSLANGLALEGKRVNNVLRMQMFRDLLEAAGYPSEMAQIVRTDIVDEIAFRLAGDRKLAQGLVDYLDQWPFLPLGERELLIRALRRFAEASDTGKK